MGRAGKVRGGDRLPWVQIGPDGGGQDGAPADNFAPLASLDWQVHVYGAAAPTLEALCTERRMRLCVFPWRRQMGRAGMRRNALYLVRPDGYVALADPEDSGAALQAFLDQRRLIPAKSR